jgi:hypothetical protein
MCGLNGPKNFTKHYKGLTSEGGDATVVNEGDTTDGRV